MQKSLTKTLTFQLNITEGSQQLLNSGQIEARRVINEIYRLDNENYDWNTIEKPRTRTLETSVHAEK